MPIRVHDDPAENTTYILACDLLTFRNCHLLQDALLDAIARQRRIVVDLRLAPFIDTAVLGHLALTLREDPYHKSPLEVVVAPDSQPLRVLALTGLSALMTVTVIAGEVDLARFCGHTG